MNFQLLFEKQAELDAHIEREHPTQPGEDRVSKKFLALDVELSELANEARFFKFWSDDQEPRNTVLEEYADGVHFFLSIANSKGWQDSMFLFEEAIEEFRETGFDGGLTGIFLEMKYWLLKAKLETKPDERFEKVYGRNKQEQCFRTAWSLFIAIGMIGFDFTWKEIVNAYDAKNAINHDRQAIGY